MRRMTGGLSGIKTSQKAKVRSRPKVEGSEHLDAYLLIKERQRLEGYQSVIDRNSERTEDELESVKKEIEKLEERIPLAKGSSGAREKTVRAAPYKTIMIDY